jgi:predicted exporter
MSDSSQRMDGEVNHDWEKASPGLLVAHYRDPLRWWLGVILLVLIGMVVGKIYRAAISRAYRPSVMELNLTVASMN